MKRILAMVLMIVMVVGCFAGCSPASSEEAETQAPQENTQTQVDETQSFTSGTYETEALGRKGLMKFKVTFDETRITDIQITSHRETNGVANVALETIPKEIIENQSVDIDALAGASMTSYAIVRGVKDAAKLAQGNMELLTQKVERAEVARESITGEYDLAIIGAGPAGLMAAQTAAEAGKKVIIFEKLPFVGGNLLSAAGVISGAGTKMHDAQGITDLTPESYLAHRMAISSNPDSKYYTEDPIYTRLFFNLNRDMVNFLIDRGVEFVPNPRSVSHVLAPGYFKGSGNFAMWLQKTIEEAGGDVVLSTEVTDVLVDNGQVVGVKAVGKNTDYTISAKAVILASGGFTSNKEMIGECYPEYKDVYSTAQVTTLGDGIRLAKQAGGSIHALDAGVHKMYLAGKSLNEIPFFLFFTPAMVVNAYGERCLNEYGNYSMNSDVLLQEENGGYGWIIFDKEGKEACYEEYQGLFEWGDVQQFASVDEMAEALALPNLPDSIEKFNQMVEAGEDLDFGRTDPMFQTIEGEELYAMKLVPGLYMTYGGVKVDLDTHVMTENGIQVPHFYAAGDVCGSFEVQEGMRYTAGVTQALSFGRLAAQMAMEEME